MFKKAAQDSRYEGRALIKEFRRRMNSVIRRKLMEEEQPLRSIEQWYERTINLDKH